MLEAAVTGKYFGVACTNGLLAGSSFFFNAHLLTGGRQTDSRSKRRWPYQHPADQQV
jgi:hypothetical protein